VLNKPIFEKNIRKSWKFYNDKNINSPQGIDSSPSINSERNEFSNNRIQVTDSRVEQLAKLNQNNPRIYTQSYLYNLEWKESNDFGVMDSTFK